MKLPNKISMADFDQTFRLQPALWTEAIEDCCRLHKISSNQITAFADGSNLVAAVDDRYIVKIFPPFHQHQWESESRVLQHLDGKLEIPIPKLLASGQRGDSWYYVIITRLKGKTLEKNWSTFSFAEKEVALNYIGQVMAQTHEVPVGGLATLSPQWDQFIKAQISNALDRHRRLKMPEWFLNELPIFLKSVSAFLPSSITPVILTGEYTPFNLMYIPERGNQISGMIDFGDAMIGFNEYDLLGPSLFLCEGKSPLVHSLFQGYGYTPKDINLTLQKRLMVLQVLHRYSHFHMQLRIPDWQSRVHSISELMELIWPL